MVSFKWEDSIMKTKKIVATFTATVVMLQSVFVHSTFADTHILTDTPRDVFVGRSDGIDVIRNINFTDVPAYHFAQQSIVQGGALNLIAGYDTTFNPSGVLSRQEALVFILRAIGMENEAVTAAVGLQDVMPPESTTRNLWSLGYLQVATSLGLITQLDLEDSLFEEEEEVEEIAPAVEEPEEDDDLDDDSDDDTTDELPEVLEEATPRERFMREEPATRQEVARWVMQAIQSVDNSIFDTTLPIQSIYQFSDWEYISVDNIAAVEMLSSQNIMIGSNGMFNPQGTLTRAEMALLMGNLDSIYFELMGLQRRFGTVGAMQISQAMQQGSATVWRNFFIRTDDGSVDIIQRSYEYSVSPQNVILDTPVHRNGQITGLLGLEEGDRIQYIVDTTTNEVLFVNVLGESATIDIAGRIFSIDVDERTINITDEQGRHFIYPLAEGLLTNEDGVDHIRIDGTVMPLDTVRHGSNHALTLTDNVVVAIQHLGERELFPEIRGIVIANNPHFSYLTIRDNYSRELTFQYFSNDILVVKREHYSMADTQGYLSRMFPSYVFNPNQTVISQVQPGNIVFIRTDPDRPDVISSISAATNYVAQHGRIMQLTHDGNVMNMLIQYENNQTAWFSMPSSIPIFREGRPTNVAGLQVGDWVRLLVNQAIISPGHIMESVREIVVEGDDRFISNIVRGQLAGINSIQNEIIVQNAQTLTGVGWTGHRNLDQFDLTAHDIEFFNGGQRISRDHALHYLTRASGEVYIALENHFAGERVRRVTFRPDRDEILEPDTIINSDGVGNFTVSTNNRQISTDDGTIVRRNGRLVNPQNIMVPDFARVVLNGAGTAAIVDIADAPDTSGVVIIRARIQSVDAGASFTAQSMSVLSGVDWNFTPIQRIFTIDHNTLFLNEFGFVDPSTFLGYSDTSVVDSVFNIVVDGSRAARVVDAPFSNNAVRGTIFQIEDGSISIRDAEHYDRATNTWRRVSNINSVATILTEPNTIIARNNEVLSGSSGLQVGDQIRVMTVALPDVIESGMSVDGQIIFVER